MLTKPPPPSLTNHKLNKIVKALWEGGPNRLLTISYKKAAHTSFASYTDNFGVHFNPCLNLVIFLTDPKILYALQMVRMFIQLIKSILGHA